MHRPMAPLSESSPPGLPGRTPAPGAGGGATGTPLAAVKSESLFKGAAELQIDHGGVMYRLRQTSLGKLILTK
jgi:hemin uptake protein HemP